MIWCSFLLMAVIKWTLKIEQKRTLLLTLSCSWHDAGGVLGRLSFV